MHAQTAPAILGYRNLGTDIATACLKAEIGTKARSSDFRAQSAPPTSDPWKWNGRTRRRKKRPSSSRSNDQSRRWSPALVAHWQGDGRKRRRRNTRSQHGPESSSSSSSSQQSHALAHGSPKQQQQQHCPQMAMEGIASGVHAPLVAAVGGRWIASKPPRANIDLRCCLLLPRVAGRAGGARGSSQVPLHHFRCVERWCLVPGYRIITWSAGSTDLSPATPAHFTQYYYFARARGHLRMLRGASTFTAGKIPLLPFHFYFILLVVEVATKME